NGEGFLIYRGETMGLEEPVASIRLKLLRRGSQDYEYFWLLAHKKDVRAVADQVANSVIHEPLGTNGAWGRGWHVEAQRRRMGARPLQDGRSDRKTSGRREPVESGRATKPAPAVHSNIYQSSFNPSWITRESPAPRIRPNAPDVTVVVTLVKLTWLKILNASARN